MILFNCPSDFCRRPSAPPLRRPAPARAARAPRWALRLQWAATATGPLVTTSTIRSTTRSPSTTSTGTGTFLDFHIQMLGSFPKQLTSKLLPPLFSTSSGERKHSNKNPQGHLSSRSFSVSPPCYSCGIGQVGQPKASL